jgi:hypothetical protein
MNAPETGPDEPTAEDERDGLGEGPTERRELAFDGYDVVADTKVALSPVVIVERPARAGTS